jgi:hypothetical protein
MKTGKQSRVVRTQEFCLPYLVLLGEHLYFLLYIALLEVARFSCVHLNGHTFEQNLACAGTYCCFKNTITFYVMMLNYVLQVSLQLHKFARPQCEVPVHYRKAYVGVEL